MSDDLPMIVTAGAAGLGLGGLNAWGLWVTSRDVTHAPFPGMLLLVSLVVRTLVPLALILLIAHGLLPRLVAGVAGLLVGRLIAVRVLAARAHEPSEREVR